MDRRIRRPLATLVALGVVLIAHRPAYQVWYEPDELDYHRFDIIH